MLLYSIWGRVDEKQITDITKTWINFKGIMLSQRSQFQKVKYYYDSIYTTFWKKTKLQWVGTDHWLLGVRDGEGCGSMREVLFCFVFLVIELLPILIVVVVTWIYTWVKTHSTVYPSKVKKWFLLCINFKKKNVLGCILSWRLFCFSPHKD